eukprot:4708910-Pyramimonas_sp.AAC.1
MPLSSCNNEEEEEKDACVREADRRPPRWRLARRARHVGVEKVEETVESASAPSICSSICAAPFIAEPCCARFAFDTAEPCFPK